MKHTNIYSCKKHGHLFFQIQILDLNIKQFFPEERNVVVTAYQQFWDTDCCYKTKIKSACADVTKRCNKGDTLSKQKDNIEYNKLKIC